MNIKLEEIPAKIQELKDKRSKAEGAIENIMDRLDKEFGCKTVEETEVKLKTIQDDIEKDEKELAVIMKELEGATDWNKI